MTPWYRKESWARSDEEEFFAKLHRARKDSRAQYLKIQAITLSKTKDPYLLDVAEFLLNKLLVEYPDHRIERSSSLDTLGNIYNYRNNHDKAIEYFKMAIELEDEYPNVITQAYLKFSELVVKYSKEIYYDYSEKLLIERLADHSFNSEKYKAYSILSILNKKKSLLDKAIEFASLAEKYANAETSGLRYHKYLGVVTNRDTWLDSIVKDE